jgi:hypothetical protein
MRTRPSPVLPDILLSGARGGALCQAASGVCPRDPPQPLGVAERAPAPVACLFGPVSAMHRCQVVGSAIRHRPASGEGLDRDRRPFTPGTFSIALPADRERATAPSSAAQRGRQAPARPVIARIVLAGGRPGRWNLQGCFDGQTAPAAQARQSPPVIGPGLVKHQGAVWPSIRAPHHSAGMAFCAADT